jgi:WD40 repeat protein
MESKTRPGPLSRDSQVKGVAWDPVGKYLASSGQDQALVRGGFGGGGG